MKKKTPVRSWPFKSSSSSKVYQTILWHDGSLSCNCPGWIFKKAGEPRARKHSVMVLNNVLLKAAAA